jgi:hypothetical protein
MTEEQKPIDGNICQKPTFKVELTVYEWHKLLKELEFLRNICNRDQDDVIDLWEKISTQLSDTRQVIFGSKRHRELEPDIFKKTEVPPASKQEPPIKKETWGFLNPFSWMK